MANAFQSRSIGRGAYLALLLGTLMLEEALFERKVYGLLDFFWLGGDSFEWYSFCLFHLPTLLMLPMAWVTDRYIGRAKAIPWGLGLFAGAYLVTYIFPMGGMIGAFVLMSGHVLFAPAAFLSAVVAVSKDQGQKDHGFLMAWLSLYAGFAFLKPLLDIYALGNWILLLVLGLGGLSFLFWKLRLQVSGSEPPAVPKAGGQQAQTFINLFFASLLGIPAYFVLNLSGSYFDYVLLHSSTFGFLIGVGAVLVMAFTLKSQRLWFVLACFMALLAGLFSSNLTFLTAFLGSDQVGFGAESLGGLLASVGPFLIGAAAVLAAEYGLPKGLPLRALVLMRAAGGFLLLAIVYGLGMRWLGTGAELVLSVAYGAGWALLIPSIWFLVWENAPSKFKTLAVAFCLCVLSLCGQFSSNLLQVLSADSPMGPAEYQADLHLALLGLGLFLLAGMGVLWMRLRKA